MLLKNSCFNKNQTLSNYLLLTKLKMKSQIKTDNLNEIKIN